MYESGGGVTERRERRAYSRTGLNALKARVKVHGLQAVDRRTAGARELLAWRTQLIADLGGQDALTAAQGALVDMAARTWLYIGSVDLWLLEQRSLVNLRRRSLLPVVRERQQLVDSLARLLTTLGLERRARKVPDLREYVEARYGTSESRAANGAGERAQAQDAAPAADAATTPRDPAAGRAEGGAWSV